jgi:hypothetical protein
MWGCSARENNTDPNLHAYVKYVKRIFILLFAADFMKTLILFDILLTM